MNQTYKDQFTPWKPCFVVSLDGEYDVIENKDNWKQSDCLKVLKINKAILIMMGKIK